MIKVQAHEVHQASRLLSCIINEGRDQRTTIPAQASYRLARLAKALSSEASIIEEKRIELIKKHGAEVMRINKGEEGMLDEEIPTGEWSVPPENMQAYLAEWNAVANAEIELSIEPISFDSFGNGGSFFTITEIIALDSFLIPPTLG